MSSISLSLSFALFSEASLRKLALVFVPRHSNSPGIYPVVVAYTSQLTYWFNIGTAGHAVGVRDCSISRRVHAFDKRRHRKVLEKSSAVKGPRVEALAVIVERFDDPPCTCPVHGDKYLTGVNGNTRGPGNTREGKTNAAETWNFVTLRVVGR